jgi:trans-aconitate methyltransferase
MAVLDRSRAKLTRLGPEHAPPSLDESVVVSCASRPPYPLGAIAVLRMLLGEGASEVLELGCGSGDLTVALAPHVQRIDAFDPSPTMLRAARARTRLHEHVRFLTESAASFEPRRRYRLIIVGENLHWTDWQEVLPKLGSALLEDGVLAIVGPRRFDGLPWDGEIRRLITRYASNQHEQAYDLVDELVRRGLFTEQGRSSHVRPHRQSIAAYVESFHSETGLARSRVAQGDIEAFDTALQALIESHHGGATIAGALRAEVVWGVPKGS